MNNTLAEYYKLLMERVPESLQNAELPSEPTIVAEKQMEGKKTLLEMSGQRNKERVRKRNQSSRLPSLFNNVAQMQRGNTLLQGSHLNGQGTGSSETV